MEKFNLYELNNMVMTDRSTTAVHGLSRDVTNDLPKDNANFRLLKDQKGSDSHRTSSNEYEEYISTNDGQLGFMYEDDGNYNNVKSTARNIPREFQAPVLQTNYFDEEYPDLYGKHEIRDYNRILEGNYDGNQHLPITENYLRDKNIRSNIPPTIQRKRQNLSTSKKRKYSKHKPSLGGKHPQNNYDPWRDIYQEGLFNNDAKEKTPKSDTSYHRSPGHEKHQKNNLNGYQVMANKVLYKTKSGDDALTNSNRSKERFDNENTIAQNSDKRSKVFSLEDEGQFAADFQRQHHLNRWGQAGRHRNSHSRYPEREIERYGDNVPIRRRASMFGQKSGGVYQSPLLKTFSTTSRDSFYDYEDPLSNAYDDLADYMEHDKNSKGNMRNGVIEKVSNVLDYDYYDDPFGWGSGGLQQSGSGNPGSGFTDTITRRVADAVFSPTVITVIGVLALPLILGAVYWLFVVNGPTPVVKARIDDLLGIKTGHGGNISEPSLGMNNFVEGGGEVTYTEVAPIWESIGKPIMDTVLTLLQKFGSVSPSSSSSSGGFINKEPLFSEMTSELFSKFFADKEE